MWIGGEIGCRLTESAFPRTRAHRHVSRLSIGWIDQFAQSDENSIIIVFKHFGYIGNNHSPLVIFGKQFLK